MKGLQIIIYLFFGIITYSQSFQVSDFTDRILRFHTDIDVQKNGQVHVTEYITIYNGNGQGNATNNDIQRGIVRDFPTVYTDKDGYKVKTGFSLKRVSRNEYT